MFSQSLGFDKAWTKSFEFDMHREKCFEGLCLALSMVRQEQSGPSKDKRMRSEVVVSPNLKTVEVDLSCFCCFNGLACV